MTHSFNQALDVIDEKSEVAGQIAQKHFQVEAGLEKIIRLKGSAEAEVSPVEPIKLLEVNANTVPSGVLPVNFGRVQERCCSRIFTLKKSMADF